jgi:heme-degrading monooxygenase HmoA
MIVLLYATVPRSEAVMPQYNEDKRAMRQLAESVPGFVGWDEYPAPDNGTFGVLRFEDETALAAWRDHPDHGEAHRRGVEDLYASYRVEVCERVRDSSFTWPGPNGDAAG